jgi:hypothetical protein
MWWCGVMVVDRERPNPPPSVSASTKQTKDQRDSSGPISSPRPNPSVPVPRTHRHDADAEDLAAAHLRAGEDRHDEEEEEERGGPPLGDDRLDKGRVLHLRHEEVQVVLHAPELFGWCGVWGGGRAGGWSVSEGGNSPSVVSRCQGVGPDRGWWNDDQPRAKRQGTAALPPPKPQHSHLVARRLGGKARGGGLGHLGLLRATAGGRLEVSRGHEAGCGGLDGSHCRGWLLGGLGKSFLLLLLLIVCVCVRVRGGQGCV